MALSNKTDILNAIRAKFGEDNSDDTIKIIEDISDTFDDYETKTRDSTNWEQKYKDNDAEWRKKYKERFFSTGTKDDAVIGEQDDVEENKKLSYENLFKESEK